MLSVDEYHWKEMPDPVLALGRFNVVEPEPQNAGVATVIAPAVIVPHGGTVNSLTPISGVALLVLQSMSVVTLTTVPESMSGRLSATAAVCRSEAETNTGLMFFECAS